MAKTPVPDTTPRHDDSRQTGWASYAGQADPTEGQSESQDEGEQDSLSSKLGPNPNATGRVMSQPYSETSPRFEDSNGFDQTWNEAASIDGKTYREYPV